LRYGIAYLPALQDTLHTLCHHRKKMARSEHAAPANQTSPPLHLPSCERRRRGRRPALLSGYRLFVSSTTATRTRLCLAARTFYRYCARFAHYAHTRRTLLPPRTTSTMEGSPHPAYCPLTTGMPHYTHMHTRVTACAASLHPSLTSLPAPCYHNNHLCCSHSSSTVFSNVAGSLPLPCYTTFNIYNSTHFTHTLHCHTWEGHVPFLLCSPLMHFHCPLLLASHV